MLELKKLDTDYVLSWKLSDVVKNNFSMVAEDPAFGVIMDALVQQRKREKV